MAEWYELIAWMNGPCTYIAMGFAAGVAFCYAKRRWGGGE